MAFSIKDVPATEDNSGASLWPCTEAIPAMAAFMKESMASNSNNGAESD